MNTWVYIFDEFKPIGIDTSELLEEAEESSKLFESIKDVLSDYTREIKDMKVYDIYFDPPQIRTSS